MNVNEIMTSPVETLDPETPIETAAVRMFRRRLVAMPVVENGALIGIVGEADLYRTVAAIRGVPLGGTVPFDALGRPRVVSDLMRRNVLWVNATDSVRLAAQRLMRHARSLPVLDRGRVVGLVTRHDIIRAIGGPVANGLAARATEPAGGRHKTCGSIRLPEPVRRARTTVAGRAPNSDAASEASRIDLLLDRTTGSR